MPGRSLRVAYQGCDLEANSAINTFVLGADWLAGACEDAVFAGAVFVGVEQGLALFRKDDLLIGHASETLGSSDLANATTKLYQRVLAACEGRHLYRIWNHVPRINAWAAGLENYRAFCLGRSLAFENHFGTGFQSQLSAASAVGGDGDRLDLLFIAGTARPRHFENPEQVPAYQYPAEHGPRAPSFARATIAQSGGRNFIFISGTSAIKGHATIAPGALTDQVVCTLDNLRLISRETGLGDRLGLDSAWNRHFKIYLRNVGDLATVRAAMEREWLRPSENVTYLRADVCRSALNLEIEATLVR